jgi:hypothetical protein
MRHAVDVRVPDWISVSATRSCPRCGGATGCEVAEDAAAVRCRAVPSERPFAGGGWFHALPPVHGGPAAPTTVPARSLPPTHAEGCRSDGGGDPGYSPAAARRRSDGSGSDTRRRGRGGGSASP